MNSNPRKNYNIYFSRKLINMKAKFNDNIDDDLLTEILIRLPDSRLAVRLAAVCKRWSSLISDSQLIQSFFDHRNDSDYSAASPLALLLQKHH